jgi:hypothetical protein
MQYFRNGFRDVECVEVHDWRVTWSAALGVGTPPSAAVVVVVVVVVVVLFNARQVDNRQW